MVLPWFCHDFPMFYHVLPWFYHGFTMILPWFYHDFPHGFTMIFHGFTVNFPWFYHDFTMALPWFCHGKAMVISRTPTHPSVASSMCHPQWRCSRMVHWFGSEKMGGYDEIDEFIHVIVYHLNVMSYWWCLYFCMLHSKNTIWNGRKMMKCEIWRQPIFTQSHLNVSYCFPKALVSV